MFWYEGISNGMDLINILIFISQMIFISKMPKSFENSEMQGGGWEIGKLGEISTSQFPNFPKKFQLIWLNII